MAGSTVFAIENIIDFVIGRIYFHFVATIKTLVHIDMVKLLQIKW